MKPVDEAKKHIGKSIHDMTPEERKKIANRLFADGTMKKILSCLADVEIGKDKCKESK